MYKIGKKVVLLSEFNQGIFGKMEPSNDYQGTLFSLMPRSAQNAGRQSGNEHSEYRTTTWVTLDIFFLGGECKITIWDVR